MESYMKRKPQKRNVEVDILKPSLFSKELKVSAITEAKMPI